jgi:ribulose-phosphate 3-epimerase
MKKEILPAILEKSFKVIEKKVERASEAGVKIVQIDICDGELTPSKTFASVPRSDSFTKIGQLSQKVEIELDMIVKMKDKANNNFLEAILLSKPKRVIFHFSGVKNWDEIFEKFKKNRIKVALGIWLNDDNKKVTKLLEEYPFDYIQIMGIEKVGFGGQKLSKKVFKKVAYFFKKYPELPIQVDGGVKLENLKKLKEVGVSRFVSGSGIFAYENIKERIKEYKKEIS